MSLDQGKIDDASRNLSKSLTKKIIALVIVIAVATASYISLYTLKTSSIHVTLSNMDKYAQVHFGLYLNGSLYAMDYLGSLMNKSYSISVRPGTYNVSLDYDKAFVQPHVDGLIDFFQKADVGPFYTKNLTWVIPSSWS